MKPLLFALLVAMLFCLMSCNEITESGPDNHVALDATVMDSLGNLIDEGIVSFSYVLESASVKDGTPVCDMQVFAVSEGDSNSVRIRWKTARESNLTGYNLYRSEVEAFSSAQCITPTPISPTNTGSEHTYIYTDTDRELLHTYYYWLIVSPAPTGNHPWGPMSVYITGYTAPPIIDDSVINDIYPNPVTSNDNTIECWVRTGCQGTLRIQSVRGVWQSYFPLHSGHHILHLDLNEFHYPSGKYSYDFLVIDENENVSAHIVKYFWINRNDGAEYTWTDNGRFTLERNYLDCGSLFEGLDSAGISTGLYRVTNFLHLRIVKAPYGMYEELFEIDPDHTLYKTFVMPPGKSRLQSK